MRHEVGEGPDGGVSISAILGTKLLLRATFDLAAWSRSIKGTVHLSKNAERRFGQQCVCQTITDVFRTLLSRDALCQLPGREGTRLGLRSYEVTVLAVEGKPLNCRVDFAIEHAARVRSSHNEALTQSRNAAWLGYHARVTPLSRPLPSLRLFSPPLSPTVSRPVTHPATGIRLSAFQAGVDECGICMDTLLVRSVTCCVGKWVCDPCVRQLQVHHGRPCAVPPCPWCRR